MGQENKGLYLLDKSITILTGNLERYANRPDSNESYIKSQNDIFRDLRGAYNYFERVSYFETWANAEKVMKAQQNTDPVISGHWIFVRIKPEGKNYSTIDTTSFDL